MIELNAALVIEIVKAGGGVTVNADGSFVVTGAPTKASLRAERNRRYSEKKRLEASSCVSNRLISSESSNGSPSSSPSLTLSPSPSPTPPSSPALPLPPTPPPAPAHTREKPSNKIHEVPETFSPAAAEAIEEWQSYKRERNERYKPRGWKALMSFVAKFDDEVIIEAVNASIRNEYKGLFLEETKAKMAALRSKHQQPSTPTPPKSSAPFDNWREIVEEVTGHPVPDWQEWRELDIDIRDRARELHARKVGELSLA